MKYDHLHPSLPSTIVSSYQKRSLTLQENHCSSDCAAIPVCSLVQRLRQVPTGGSIVYFHLRSCYRHKQYPSLQLSTFSSERYLKQSRTRADNLHPAAHYNPH